MIVSLLLTTLALGDSVLTNGGFETRSRRSVPGWEVSIGALNGGDGPLSKVGFDRKRRWEGKSSLHLSADKQTLAFQVVSQAVDASPGGTYALSGRARLENVRRETNVRGLRQFDNCYLALFLYDGNGEIAARRVLMPERDTEEWQELSTQVEAPITVRRAEVKLFLSISGDVWFDDLSLTVDGGDRLPEPLRVFQESFTGRGEVPPAWLIEEGARNGGTEPVSRVEIDAGESRGPGKRSLFLGGDERTLLWRSVNRRFQAEPGDAFHLTAAVKAADVRHETNVKGIRQFANHHARIVFFDDDGEVLGAPRFVHPGTGSYDWTDVSLRASAPAGTVSGMVGFFLSMSGGVWIDDIELTRQTGGAPAYEGWHEHTTEHLVIRYAPDHPQAGEMALVAERLEQALAVMQETLALTVDEPISVFLYRDGDQGRLLTGRELDYAEPERRAVHQRFHSTPGHELTHVVALDWGYAQTGLLGEGLAVWLDGTDPDSHHEAVEEWHRRDWLPSMDELLTDFRNQPKGYPAAGSFCGWFLQAYGRDKLQRLYPRADLERAASEVVGKTMADLEAEWRAFLGARD